jgi:hypothetical protein
VYAHGKGLLVTLPCAHARQRGHVVRTYAPGSSWGHAAYSLPCGLGHLRMAKAGHNKCFAHGNDSRTVKDQRTAKEHAGQRGGRTEKNRWHGKEEGAWQRRGGTAKRRAHGKDQDARQRLYRAKLAMRTAMMSLLSDCLLCDLCRATTHDGKLVFSRSDTNWASERPVHERVHNNMALHICLNTATTIIAFCLNPTQGRRLNRTFFILGNGICLNMSMWIACTAGSTRPYPHT